MAPDLRFLYRLDNKMTDSRNPDAPHRPVYTPRICPFVKAPPSPDCYCLQDGALDIPLTVSVCGGAFESCIYYIAHIRKTDEKE